MRTRPRVVQMFSATLAWVAVAGFGVGFALADVRTVTASLALLTGTVAVQATYDRLF